MKKNIVFLIIIATLFLTGCFGWFEKKVEPRPAAQEKVSTKVQVIEPQTLGTGRTQAPQATSFQDGDLYLEAMVSKDLKICAQIVNEKLKAKCGEELKKQ